MSYIYLQEQGEVSSAASFADIPPFALSRLNLTHGKSYCSDNETESCLSSRSGTTLPLSTENLGAEKLTSSAEDSHARTSARPARAQDLVANDLDCGPRWPESFARWDRDTCSWRTPQCSLLAGLDVFSETWPRWGIMRAGECSVQSMPAHLTNETGSGLLPTPVADDAMDSEQVKMWPTPQSSDHKGAGKNGELRDRLDYAAERGGTKSNEYPAPPESGGQLNPTWVEWLMGWPIGWTDLKPLETAKFQAWPHSHGKFSAVKTPNLTS
jgi:hypothetical protein